MKSHRSLAFLVLLSALALPFHSLAAEVLRVAFPADSVAPNKPVHAIGMSRENLWSMLGEPSARLTRDVWIYFDYQSNLDADNARGLDTLVVGFKDDRVIGLKLTDRKTVLGLLARSPAAGAFAFAEK